MLSPQEFIDHFIIGLNIKHLVAGFDFSYGHKGKGDMNTIQSQSRDAFMFSTIDKIEANGEKISCTRIRKLLDAGNVERLYDVLNRHFYTYGIDRKSTRLNCS